VTRSESGTPSLPWSPLEPDSRLPHASFRDTRLWGVPPVRPRPVSQPPSDQLSDDHPIRARTSTDTHGQSHQASPGIRPAYRPMNLASGRRGRRFQSGHPDPGQACFSSSGTGLLSSRVGLILLFAHLQPEDPAWWPGPAGAQIPLVSRGVGYVESDDGDFGLFRHVEGVGRSQAKPD
jgi:hypothetical protein